MTPFCRGADAENGGWCTFRIKETQTIMTRRVSDTGYRVCAGCGETFRSEPTSTGRRRKCDDCRADTRECSGCSISFVPTRHTTDLYRDCIMAKNPRAYQCPYDYCLEVYVPDAKSPHKCPTPKRKRPDRLAVVNGQPDMVVLCGPPVSPNAIGVRNPDPTTTALVAA